MISASQRLPPAPRLGTVGLWCGLHGDSFLQAGMHHLEARFDFARLRDQLAQQGVNTMKPFSDFEFLRQAFTEGERWPVRPARVEATAGARADHEGTGGALSARRRDRQPSRKPATQGRLQRLQPEIRQRDHLRHGSAQGAGGACNVNRCCRAISIRRDDRETHEPHESRIKRENAGVLRCMEFSARSFLSCNSCVSWLLSGGLA